MRDDVTGPIRGHGLDRIRFVVETAFTWITYAWFIAYSGALIGGAFLRQVLGGDAVLYAAAARTWLIGGNPWHATVIWAGGTTNTFAAPPPTLLAYVPFAFLPGPIAGAFWVAADVLAIVLVVRRLKRPLVWCLFPPAIDAMLVGNPEPVMLAILVLAPRWTSGLAAVLKPYAALPLLAHRRWTALSAALIVAIASLPFLPWATFLAMTNEVNSTLAEQAGGGLAVWATPILIPFAILALLVVGAKRGSWLVVPVFWPYATLHYATIALPGLSVLTGILFSLPVPGASAVGVVALGVTVAVRRWSAGTPLDTSAGSGGATSAA